MDIIIRKAEEKDSKKWYELLNRVWRDAYKNIFPEEVFVYQEKNIDKNQKYFIDNLLNKDDKILYVAEYDNKIIGVMWGELNSTYKYFHDEYADLVALYIDPNYQGRKIATHLKTIFESWAKEKGATKYVIGVLKDNIKARIVYERWGGKLSNYESEFVKLDVGYKEVFYIYDLNGGKIK